MSDEKETDIKEQVEAEGEVESVDSVKDRVEAKRKYYQGWKEKHQKDMVGATPEKIEHLKSKIATIDEKLAMLDKGVIPTRQTKTASQKKSTKPKIVSEGDVSEEDIEEKPVKKVDKKAGKKEKPKKVEATEDQDIGITSPEELDELKNELNK